VAQYHQEFHVTVTFEIGAPDCFRSGTRKLLFGEAPSMSLTWAILFWKNSNATILLGVCGGNRDVRADWVGSTSRPVQGTEDG
jgi:hypothetical protein